MSQETETNLLNAFADESVTYRRYQLYAERAEEDGFPQVARLFRAVARAESIHARNHFNCLDALGSTRDNLMAASIEEHQGFTRTYSDFLEQAKIDRNLRAEKSFEYARKVEKAHHELFEAALAAVKAGQTPEDESYYVCGVCANTVTGQPPEKCPVCTSGRGAYVEVA